MKKLFFYLYGQNPVVRNCHCHICHNFTPNQNLSINCCVRFLFLKEVHLLKDGIRFSSWNYNLQCAGPWCEPAVCSTKRMTLKAGDTVLYYNKNKYWYVLYFILLFLCPSSLFCAVAHIAVTSVPWTVFWHLLTIVFIVFCIVQESISKLVKLNFWTLKITWLISCISVLLYNVRSQWASQVQKKKIW